jgi:hypothetical protein
MKGMIFTEFLDMVSEEMGLEMTDRIIADAGLPNAGAYTSVGTYDHLEMGRLLGALSAATGKPVSDLLKAFGEYLFRRFSVGYQAFFRDCRGAFEFLQNVDDYIHVEVRKLYPDAQLPKFTVEHRSASELALLYASPRCLGDLAEGLIRGCIAHFSVPMQLTRQELPMVDGEQKVVFRLLRDAG